MLAEKTRMSQTCWTPSFNIDLLKNLTCCHGVDDGHRDLRALRAQDGRRAVRVAYAQAPPSPLA